MRKSQITLDFDKAYWTPPLSALQAYELEAEFDLPDAGVRRTVRMLLDERILCA